VVVSERENNLHNLKDVIIERMEWKAYHSLKDWKKKKTTTQWLYKPVCAFHSRAHAIQAILQFVACMKLGKSALELCLPLRHWGLYAHEMSSGW